MAFFFLQALIRVCAFINSLQTCLLTFVYQAPRQIAEMPTRQHGEVRTTWMGIQDTWDTVGDLAGNSSNEESQVEGFLAWPRGAERARGPHRRWRGTHGLATAGTVTIPKAKETGGTGESCNPGGGTGPREVTELPSETGCQNGAGGREQPSLAVPPSPVGRGPPIGQSQRGGQEVPLWGLVSRSREGRETWRRDPDGGRREEPEEPAFPSLALPPSNLLPRARPSLS